MHKNAFTPENTAMLLIDHQVGTISWASSRNSAEVKRSALALARIATAFDMPLVLSSSMEENIQGPMLPAFEKVAPVAFSRRIRRAGIVNAMHDKTFSDAVKATGRKKVIVAGITTEVCVVFPVLQLLDEGYEVQMVTDASASLTRLGEEAALRRMEQAGAVLTSTSQVISELALDWTTPKGKELQDILVRGQPFTRLASVGLRWLAAMTGYRIARIFRVHRGAPRAAQD